MAPVTYTPIGQRTNELGSRSFMSDDGMGYPNRATWVAEDQGSLDGIVWGTLVDRKEPVVIVGLKTETIIVPRPRTLLDRIRETVPVTITVRVESGPPSYTVQTNLGRNPVTEIRPAETIAA